LYFFGKIQNIYFKNSIKNVKRCKILHENDSKYTQILCKWMDCIWLCSKRQNLH
jgi:hypothetical protein